MNFNDQYILGSHTGEKIADTIRKGLLTWGIELENCIATTDSAANEVKAFDLLGIPRLPCAGHNFNLVVNAGLDVPEIEEIAGKSRKLVTHMHKSSTSSDFFNAKQKALDPGKVLIALDIL